MQYNYAHVHNLKIFVNSQTRHQTEHNCMRALLASYSMEIAKITNKCIYNIYYLTLWLSDALLRDKNQPSFQRTNCLFVFECYTWSKTRCPDESFLRLLSYQISQCEALLVHWMTVILRCKPQACDGCTPSCQSITEAELHRRTFFQHYGMDDIDNHYQNNKTQWHDGSESGWCNRHWPSFAAVLGIIANNSKMPHGKIVYPTTHIWFWLCVAKFIQKGLP